jgi:hypothetical protein
MAENQLINIKIRKKSPVCQADFPASRPGQSHPGVVAGAKTSCWIF